MEGDSGGVLTQINSSGFDTLHWGVVHALPLSWVSKNFRPSPLTQMHASLASALFYAANYCIEPPSPSAKQFKSLKGWPLVTVVHHFNFCCYSWSSHGRTLTIWRIVNNLHVSVPLTLKYFIRRQCSFRASDWLMWTTMCTLSKRNFPFQPSVESHSTVMCSNFPLFS